MTEKTVIYIVILTGLAILAGKIMYDLRPGMTRMELPENGNMLVITRRGEKLFTPLPGETRAEFQDRYQSWDTRWGE